MVQAERSTELTQRILDGAGTIHRNLSTPVLYEHAVRHVGLVSTLIEWDDAIPPLETLLAEAAHARAIAERVVGQTCRDVVNVA